MAPQPVAILTFGLNSHAAKAMLLALSVFLATLVMVPIALTQTFTVLHTFTGTDGGEPRAGLTMDAAGNLYGTTYGGGLHSDRCDQVGCGTVFRLHPSAQGWTLTSLYSFHATDGAQPEARVMFGPDGALYGTTFEGGTGPCNGYGCGTVFALRPPPTPCRFAPCPWKETVLWNFMSIPDGAYPTFGDLNFDSAGHVYGTTAEGGNQVNGTVFELSKLPNGQWTEVIDYNFTEISGKGAGPNAGVIFDGAGNMYTPTYFGGYDFNRCGDVVQLTDTPSGWTEHDLYTFPCFAGGEYPVGGLISDRAGNLYGTTWEGGNHAGGLVYELSPSNGSWLFNIPYGNFSGGEGPEASLVMDSAGNLYGTTSTDGRHNSGTVFKLTPSNGGWTYTALYVFTGGSDGAHPISNIIFDARGNMYGTASSGGDTTGCPGGCGLVWEITP